MVGILVAALLVASGCGDDGAGDAGPGDAAGADGGADAAGADAAAPPCDTTAQDCSDKAESKCTLVFGAMRLVTECVEPSGTRGDGDSCMREVEGMAGIGHDDCGTGLFCTGIGLAAPALACRRFCDTDGDCMAAGERCASFDMDGPLAGVCGPTCTLFDAASCPSGTTCGIVLDNDGSTRLAVCRELGTAASGTDCLQSADCGPNLTCEGMVPRTCVAHCDATHACPAGTSCEEASGLPNGGGLCR